MGRWTAGSDEDYYEECNPMHRAESEPEPMIESPDWWQAEFALIAELEKLLAGIRAERERRGD